MNAKELAAQLNGRQYGKVVTREEREAAKALGLVVVYGASDDLMEFEGAILDEVSCYDGGTAYLNKSGLLSNDCDNDECPHFEKLKQQASKIKAIWDKDGFSWIYETSIKHEIFEVFDGLDTYCRGIVFALADVESAAK